MIASSYLQKKKYPLSGERQTSPGLSSSFADKTPLQSSSFSKLNNLNSEPLKTISHDVSFKGSPVKAKDVLTITEALSSFTKEFGSTATKHLEGAIERVSKNTELTGVKRVGDKLEFAPETTGKKIKDILLYPILKMPVDIVMGALELLQKLPGLKDSKGLKKLLDADVFKKRRQEELLEAEAAAIQNLFENSKHEDPKQKLNIFKEAHGRLKGSVSNYSTKVERSLTRFVTGMIPAFFLANDAYNLSMYMKNNKTDAKEEKKRRFNQETARIVATSALTFGILSFFNKKSNSSSKVTNLLMTGATFASEFVGRIMAGNPVLPVGTGAAKKYAEKRDKEKQQQNKIQGNKVDDKKSSGAFKGGETKIQATSHTPPEEGLLTFKNAAKVFLGLVAFGFGVEKLKGDKEVKELLSKAGKGFNSHFEEDNIISRDQYTKLVGKLRANGFEQLAEKYDKIVKDQKGDKIKLGKKTITWKDTLVNKVLLYPFKFAWNSLILMPYKVTKSIADELVHSKFFQKEFKIQDAPKKVDAAKEAKEKQGKSESMLSDSIDFLRKIQEEKDDVYKQKVNESLMEGLDNVTKSKVSMADESATIRTTMQAVTSGFLIADSYNMVMIESHGQDKQLAEQKAKERTIQRTVRIAYSALIQKTVNGIFQKQYDASLLGAQAVNTVNTVITESMERKSVGLPIGESTKEQILAEEYENLHATGLKGSYYRGMAKLTGKKPMSERAAKVEEKKA